MSILYIIRMILKLQLDKLLCRVLTVVNEPRLYSDQNLHQPWMTSAVHAVQRCKHARRDETQQH